MSIFDVSVRAAIVLVAASMIGPTSLANAQTERPAVSIERWSAPPELRAAVRESL